MLDAFKMGGWGMVPTLLAGILLCMQSVRYAKRPEPRYVPVLFALGVFTLAAGALGFVTGLIVTTTNLPGVNRDDAGLIAMIGFGESLCNMALALACVTLASALACYGTWRRASLPPSTWTA